MMWRVAPQRGPLKAINAPPRPPRHPPSVEFMMRARIINFTAHPPPLVYGLGLSF